MKGAHGGLPKNRKSKNMIYSKIITNTLIRKRLLNGPIAPSYEKAVSAWPELKKHIKSPKSYLKELAIARVYEAIKAEFGPELANGIYLFNRNDVAILENSFRVCSGIELDSLEMDFSHIRAGYLRRFIYECKWGINFFKDPVYSLYIYNAYISTAQHKKVAGESSVDYFKYTGFSIYPAYVTMEKSPLKFALICEAEGKEVDETPQYVKYRNFLMGLSEEKRRYFFYSSEKSVTEFLDSFENLSESAIEKYIKDHPFGLPKQIGKCITLKALPLENSEKSHLSMLDQGSLMLFFGSDYEDTLKSFGDDRDIYEALTKLACQKADKEELPYVRILWGILKLAKTHERRCFICKLWESAYFEFEWNFLILAQHGKAIAYLDDLIKTFLEPENVTPENLMWHFTNFILRGEEKDYINVFGYEKWDISHCIDYRDSRAVYFANKAMGVKLSFNVTVGDLEQAKCDKAAELYLKLSLDARRYYARQGFGSFIELADSKSADELETFAKEKKPNLFEFILEEKIQLRRKILSSKYNKNEEPNGLDSETTK